MSDNKPLAQQFQDELNAVIDKYRDQGLTYGEGIGGIEIAKLDLWHEMDASQNEETP